MSKISRRAFTGLAAASVGTLAFPSISLGALPKVVDWVTGQPINKHGGTFWQRVKNTFYPIKSYEAPTKEGQFLIDIEYDGMPHLNVADGEKVKAGAVLFNWDPYTDVILARQSGIVELRDFIENETYQVEAVEGGKKQMVINLINSVRRVVGINKLLFAIKRKIRNVHVNVHFIINMLLPIVLAKWKLYKKQ